MTAGAQAAARICTEEYAGGTVPLNYLIDGGGRVVDAWFGHDGPGRRRACESWGIAPAEPAQ